MRYLIFIIMFFSAFPAICAQESYSSASNGFFTRCNPCILQKSFKSPQYKIYFTPVSSVSGGKRIETLRVESSETDQPVVLYLTKEMDIRDNGGFFLDLQDIDFDGFPDLLLVVSQGTSNSYAQYWRYVPSKKTFVDIGVYPIFKLDSIKHQLITHENLGEAGQLYSDKIYEWRNGKLTNIYEETQVWSRSGGGLIRTSKKLVKGKWRVISKKKVDIPPEN